jgi:hypothetical protein
MRKPFFVFLVIILLVVSCNNRPNNPPNRPIQQDAISKSLDESDSSLTGLDSLNDEDENSVEFAIAYSKYRMFEAASPTGAPQKPILGDERIFRFVSPEFKKYADSAIHALPDSLLQKQIFLIDDLLNHAFFMWQMGKKIIPDSLVSQVVPGGIKYAWGSKEYLSKYNPLLKTKNSESPSSCDQEIFGLDCSGFIYQLFKQSHIVYPDGNADYQKRESTLKRCLIPYFGQSPRVTVKEMLHPPIDSIQSGDILWFYGTNGVATHIGIALNILHKLKLFHCSGARDNCEYNISKDGGIRCVDIGSYIDQRVSGKGPVNYGVTRIVIRSK